MNGICKFVARADHQSLLHLESTTTVNVLSHVSPLWCLWEILSSHRLRFVKSLRLETRIPPKVTRPPWFHNASLKYQETVLKIYIYMYIQKTEETQTRNVQNEAI